MRVSNCILIFGVFLCLISLWTGIIGFAYINKLLVIMSEESEPSVIGGLYFDDSIKYLVIHFLSGITGIGMIIYIFNIKKRGCQEKRVAYCRAIALQLSGESVVGK